MSAKPKQRTRVDWGAARAFYAALSPTERTFAGVAREYRVTAHTVRKHAHAEGWVELAEQVDRETADSALRSALKTREQRNEMFLRVTDKAFERALDKLTLNELEVKLSDLPALGKHAELILGEATDRVSFGELQEALGVVMAIAVEYVPKPKRSAFLGRVRERLGQIGDES